jgi:hypothetical protein
MSSVCAGSGESGSALLSSYANVRTSLEVPPAAGT